MNAVIQDIIVYLCYLVVVMWVAEGPRHINSFYLKVITTTNVEVWCGVDSHENNSLSSRLLFTLHL